MIDADTLDKLPTSPGVYTFYDAANIVVYVGKAKNLRVRVRQYFRAGGDARFFVVSGLLAEAAARVETIVVRDEKEALLLENHLIKAHQPRFNIKLRDDKQYLVLRVLPQRTGRLATLFPRVEVVRNIATDDAHYYGPYHSATGARETLRVLNRHFQLRTCTDHVLETRGRPCLQYQIKRCPAPCALPVPTEAYAEQLADTQLFLAGRDQLLLARLNQRMTERAEAEQFEAAARVRDSIAAVRRTVTKQLVVQDDDIDQDVWGLAREADVAVLVALFVRGGKLLGRRVFRQRRQEVPDALVMADMLQQYYAGGAIVPEQVLVPCELEDAAVIAEWLTGLRGRRVQVHWPQRGDKVRLLELATTNAATELASTSGEQDYADALRERLRLPRAPQRIECYDIAHLQGTDTVASMVVFVDGAPKKSEYRRFVIRRHGNDDFASLAEVLTRRAARMGERGWDRPDLIVIDGGRCQLSAVLAAMRQAGLVPYEPSVSTLAPVDANAISVVALAKERTDRGVLDRVFVPGVKDAVVLRANTPALFVLARLRDEAHRFANSFHGKRRSQRMLASALDDVAGIGPVRRRKLLQAFGSVAGIAAAEPRQIAKAAGLSQAAASELRAHLLALSAPVEP